MRYTLEQKAQAVAEYWLCGSYRHVARTLDLPDHKAVAPGSDRPTPPQTAPQKLFEARATTLEEAFTRTLELQVRDLPDAEFRDRTGFLKIVGEQMLLAKGRPTSIQESRSTDELDAEIAGLLRDMANTDGHG